MKSRKEYFFNLVCLLAVGMYCLIFGFSAQAQFYNGAQLSFGKNRVQHQTFIWNYYRTDAFDIYFYANGQMLADYTLYKAPSLIEAAERMLNFQPSKKLQFIIYLTEQDFRESNFAFDDENFYNQGGVTQIYGTKIYLYFDGNHAHFDKMLRSGIMNTFAHLLIEGESLGSNMAYTSYLPDWFYNGLASYYGEDWDSEIDAIVRDGILTQRFKKLEKLTPKEAMYAAHSFWKFIADRFGQETISSILYTTRSTRSFEKAFFYITGVSYEELWDDWFKYYFVIFKKEINKLGEMNMQSVLKKYNKKRIYSQITASPAGNLYAYSTNEDGQIKIFIYSAETNKKKLVFRKFHKVEDFPDLSFPKIAWHPSGEILGFTLENKGLCHFYPYYVQERKNRKRLFIDVEKITSFSYSDDGRMMVFSAYKNAQSDIFVYNFQSRSFQQLTDDIFDDIQPVFFDGQQKILFSSNRNIDSLSSDLPFYEAKPQKTFDIFMYDYEHKNPALMRITKTPHCNETDVQVISPGNVVYLSDNNGIKNRYIALFQTVISHIDTAVHHVYRASLAPLTNYPYSILEHHYDKANNEILDIVHYNGINRFFKMPFENKKLQNTPEILSLAKELRKKQLLTDSIANKRAEKNRLSGLKHGFFQVYESDSTQKREIQKDTIKNSPQEKNKKREFITPSLRYYKIQYSLNKLVTQADFSFLNTTYQQFSGANSPVYLNSGMNALFMVGIKDLFENYRITGGFRLSFDLHSHEIMLSYEDLSKRLDKQLLLYSQYIRSQTEVGYVVKQYSNSLFYILKLPFDKFNSIRLSFKVRYEKLINGGLDISSLSYPNKHYYWGGVKLEYIFDSSRELDVNLWKGVKMKIFAEYDQKFFKTDKNLCVIGIDWRKSVRVFRNMTWATRFAASTNIGSARLIYYMGGIDNWIGAKFDKTVTIDPNKPYTYQTLATNMRGFNQNIRNGNSFALINTELRIPFLQLITGHRLGNTFLNSLQANFFFDAGTAWTGLTPYSADNSLYIRYIDTGNIYAIVKRNIDPIVCGFGAGLRAYLFGYFLRFDYAWGIEGGYLRNPKGQFTFSLGTDF